MKTRDLIRLLHHNGWRLDRQNGSHRQFVHRKNPFVITIAAKDGTDVPVGTLNDILKRAGLKQS